MKNISLSDLDCIELSNETLVIAMTTQVGPRVLSLRLQAGDNVFVSLPDATIPWDGGGDYRLRGGHRLWHAPEVNKRTYIPDDAPLTINEIVNGVEMIQPTESLTGLQKTMRITLPDASATVLVEHALTNHSPFTIETAPWAITQLIPGGTAILPQPTERVDANGHLPNRPLAFWPYANVQSSLFTMGNQYSFYRADMTGEEMFKLGFANPKGWLGYHVNGTLFTKEAAYDPAATYYDFGSSSEMYCNADFIELETLGPVTAIAPGASVKHVETWKLFEVRDFVAEEAAVASLVQQLGLGN